MGNYQSTPSTENVKPTEIVSNWFNNIKQSIDECRDTMIQDIEDTLDRMANDCIVHLQSDDVIEHIARSGISEYRLDIELCKTELQALLGVTKYNLVSLSPLLVEKSTREYPEGILWYDKRSSIIPLQTRLNNLLSPIKCTLSSNSTFDTATIVFKWTLPEQPIALDQ